MCPTLTTRPTRPSEREAQGLIEDGTLHAPPPDLEDVRAGVAETRARLEAGEVSPARSVDLFLAAACNLACRYCWNDGGTFGGRARLMTPEVVDAAVDLLVRQGPSPVDLLMFGGEPLMAREAARRLVWRAREAETRHGKRFQLALNTNGTLLDAETVRWLREAEVAVLVSLDGPARVHDHNRPLKGGGGSHAAALDGIHRWADATGVFPEVRATLSADSDSWVDTFQYLASLGARSIESAYANPRAPLDERGKRARARRIVREMKDFSDWYLKYLEGLPPDREPATDKLFVSTLRQILGHRRAVHCPVHTGSMLSIGVDGSLYPCLEAEERPYLRLGDVFGGVCDTGPLRAAADRIVDDLAPCRPCWHRYHCGGGCFMHNHAWVDGRVIFSCDPVECALHGRTIEVGVDFLGRLGDRVPARFEAWYGDWAGENAG